jgi:hypothetical protein
MKRRIFCKVLLVAVAIFGLFVLSGVLLAQGSSEDAFDRVRDVQERNTDWLMAIDGVEGTAIGLGQGAQPVVLVLLEHGGVRDIPEDLEGVPVRPLVTGKIYALPGKKPPGTPGGGNGGGGGDDEESPVDPTARFDRPVPIGVSTGHPAITAGTIACRVIDGAGNVYALSNNHVYANQNAASIGDAVIQPGTYDGGSSPADDIGTLTDFEMIYFDGSDNTVDAAIALSSAANLGTATPSDGYGTPKSTTVAPKVGMTVMKYGRTTGQTKARIWGINATVNVGYGSGVARFVEQILISGGSFSAGGDSGSLIVVGKGGDVRKPVGLLFAGSSSLTVANPIDAVLDRFDVTVDGD